MQAASKRSKFGPTRTESVLLEAVANTFRIRVMRFTI